MARTNDDNWDLRTGVGATATMVATARAVASRQADPVINDQFAEVLVRAVNLRLFNQVLDGLLDFSQLGAGWLPTFFGIRARAFDNFFAGACRAGVRQAVILGAGLDCRAYRLTWPPEMALFEIDQPDVIEWKKNSLADLGRTSVALHRYVGVDLRRDWTMSLRQAGFDASKPTVWIAEGILVGYLPPTAQDEMLDAVTELSASGSRFAADYFTLQSDVVGQALNDLQDVWCRHDPHLNLRSLTFPGPRENPSVYLAERRWTTHDADQTDLFRAVGRPALSTVGWPASIQALRFLTAIRD